MRPVRGTWTSSNRPSRRWRRHGSTPRGSGASSTPLGPSFPVAALAVRDVDGDLVAATPGARRQPTVVSLSADTLLPTGHWAAQAPGPSGPLPADGGRLALFAGNRPVGYLELWGNGTPVDRTERRVLSCLARALAAGLAVGTPQPQGR